MSQDRPDCSSVHDIPPPSDSSPEDLVLLRSAIDGLRAERDSLIRRLQAAESSAREKVQLIEARWREAASQVDALKKSAQASRARLESDLTTASKRLAQVEATAAHWQRTAEELQAGNAELLAAVDKAQCRLADLETESGIYGAELQRVEGEQSAVREQLAVATVDLAQTQAALLSQQAAAVAAASRASELEHQLEETRTRLARELAEWEEAATQREAELVGARDELARRLECEESRVVELQQQIDGAQAQLCAAEAHAHDAGSEIARLNDELSAVRDEIQRERSVYESAAREREVAFQQQLQAQVVREQQEIRAREARIEALSDELEGLQADLESTRRQSAEEIANLRAHLEARQEDLSEVVQQREQLVQQLEQLISVRQELEERLAHVEADRAQQATVLVDEQSQNDELMRQLQAAVSAGEVAQQARLEAEKRAAMLQRSVAELQEQSVAILQAQESMAQRMTEAENQRVALEAERARLCAELEVAQRQGSELAEQLNQLRSELAEVRERHSTQQASGHESERERTELRLQVEKLSGVLRQLGQEREDQRTAALQTQHALGLRVEELAAERDAQALRMAELETLSSQLERDCERLKRERTAPDELRRYKTELTRLEGKIEEIERQRSEAAQNHSAAVAGYMVELNQRSESLHAREIELQRATEELGMLRRSCEDALVQLEGERRERVELERQLDELRRAAAAGTTRTSSDPPLRLQGSSASTAATPAPAVAPDKTVSATTAIKPVSPVSTPPPRSTTTTAGPALAHLKEERSLVVVHLEENKDLRDSVRRVVSQISGVQYGNTTELWDRHKDAAAFLAVNLLNRVHDPIAAITTRIGAAPERQNVFAYCADGNFGFSFGNVNFFEHPVDADACVSWLMETCGAVQRLLVASGDIEMTSQLRTALSRIRCSASVALDLRQVTDLMPMIQPEALVIDLSLPRAEGLRLISRLRADAKTRDLPIGVILPSKQKLAELRQHAARAAREGSFGPDLLATSLAAQLGAEPPAQAPDLGVAQAS